MANVNVVTDQKSAVIADAKIYEKLIKESLVICGYRVGDSFSEVTKGFGRNWIIELRFEVER